MTERRKTTMAIDAELVRAMKIAAAREDKAEYQIVEDALRRHLGFDLLERIQDRAGMTEDDAMRLANEEAHAARRSSRKRRA